MGVNKVIVGDEVKLDLTADTVSEDNLLAGATAHNAAGEPITGAVVTVPVDSELSETSENAIQNMAVAKAIKGGNSLSGSTGYTVTDSVKYPLVGLKVFGKSTQDGTPTPENPVEITSVVEPTVMVCGKNLINAMYQTTTKGGITCTNNSNGTYTLNGTATSEAVFTIVSRLDISGTYRIIGCPPNGSNGTYNISVNVDGAWSVNNYDIGNGSIINPSSYIIIAIAIRNGVTCNNLVFKPMITTDLTATYDDFEQYKGNTATIPYILNAIPVSSGGNVTIDGQEYIADYVDFEEGKYHRLVDHDKLDPAVSIVDNLNLLLETEEITDIPEAEMQAYRQLQTYNGVTNISNDKGAGLSVEYCTNKALSACVMPVTKDLQKQIDDLKAAVLSLGGNV